MLPNLLPMLATPAKPFDSYDYSFEVKWDGIRALAAVERDGWRLWGREGSVYTDRYPELEVLRRFPAGTLVDGELVVLRDGLPDLGALLSRHQLLSPLKVQHACRFCPVNYMLFDVLYHKGRCLLDEPFHRRRLALVELFEQLDEPTLIFSEAIAGEGQHLFERVVAMGHEGVVAKHQTARYRPGQRAPAWLKFKPANVSPCVIVGYRRAREGVESVLVATVADGELRYAGEVGAGFTDAARAELAGRLAKLERARPVVPCPTKARWVEPAVYCEVRWQQQTAQGRFRGASFHRCIDS